MSNDFFVTCYTQFFPTPKRGRVDLYIGKMRLETLLVLLFQRSIIDRKSNKRFFPRWFGGKNVVALAIYDLSNSGLVITQMTPNYRILAFAIEIIFRHFQTPGF